MGVTNEEYKNAYEDLKSTTCAGCTGKKTEMQSFCRRCYYSLKPSVQRSLFNRENYAENYTSALKSLKEKQQSI